MRFPRFGLALILVLTSSLVAAERPNVLMIAVDDLNDWVACLGGHPQVKTPNLDRLAARGTLFTNAHCQSPLCNPSRTSLMTGLRPSTTGVYALEPWFRTSPALKDVVTLPQFFHNHGYRTLVTGKIYHDGVLAAEQRNSGVEFDTWGHVGGFGPYPKEKLVPQPSKSELLDWGVFPTDDRDQPDWKIADWAIEQIKSLPSAQSGGQPMFLCVGFRRPHLPCFASQKWFDLYPDDDTLVMPVVKENDLDDCPKFARYMNWKLPEQRLPWLKEHNQWRPLVRSYLACISFVDSQIGRVLDAVDASPHAKNTVIVLWSDHGWHLGEKDATGKTTLWERSTRVPLIFAGPGIAVGAKCDQPAELLDVYPTVVDLAGLPAKVALEGQSLVPQLKDSTTPRDRPAITTHGPNNHAIRTTRWRYIRYADGSEELYDHEPDPNEWTNLAGDPKFAQTKSDLAKFLPAPNAAPLPGSVSRLIELRDGKVYWETRPVEP